MDPQLSRRVGRLMMTNAVRALMKQGLDQHLAFVDEVSRADSFEALPAWAQEVILAGERQLAAYQRREATGPVGEL
jgi:DNA-binding GntR family transcriptional regulator